MSTYDNYNSGDQTKQAADQTLKAAENAYKAAKDAKKAAGKAKREFKSLKELAKLIISNPYALGAAFVIFLLAICLIAVNMSPIGLMLSGFSDPASAMRSVVDETASKADKGSSSIEQRVYEELNGYLKRVDIAAGVPTKMEKVKKFVNKEGFSGDTADMIALQLMARQTVLTNFFDEGITSGTAEPSWDDYGLVYDAKTDLYFLTNSAYKTSDVIDNLSYKNTTWTVTTEVQASTAGTKDETQVISGREYSGSVSKTITIDTSGFMSSEYDDAVSKYAKEMNVSSSQARLAVDQMISDAMTIISDETGIGGSGSGSTQYTSITIDPRSANSEFLRQMIGWANSIAADNSHGYDQGQRGMPFGYGPGISRMGPDYDCSSFVGHAVEYACGQTGIPCPGGVSSINTRDEISTLTSLRDNNGRQIFVVYPRSALSLPRDLVAGDILVNTAVHTEIYAGNNTNIGAQGDQDGRQGDGNGREILVTGYWDDAWNYVIRYVGG